MLFLFSRHSCWSYLAVLKLERLARSTRRNVGASSAFLTSSNRVTGPGPSRARSRPAKNVNISSRAADRAFNVLDCKASNRDACRGCASWGSVLVILLDDDTVLSDTGERNVAVGNSANASSSTRDCLNADTVLGVLDSGARDGDGLDSVIGAATD